MEFIDQKIMLKFVTTNLRGNNIVIDNINIYDPQNTNLKDYDLSDITIQPNPSDGIFELLCQNQYIKSIQVANSIGQSIITKKVNRSISNYSIDIKNYNSGLYFITIKSEENELTIPIIKK